MLDILGNDGFSEIRGESVIPKHTQIIQIFCFCLVCSFFTEIPTLMCKARMNLNGHCLVGKHKTNHYQVEFVLIYRQPQRGGVEV